MIRHMLITMALIATILGSACTGNRNTDNATDQTQVAAQQTETAILSSSPETEQNLVGAEGVAADKPTASPAPAGKVIQMSTADFKKKIFNYDKNPDEWVFEGERPAIVDFYADWCRPCKLVAPIMDELAAKYAGQLDIYKVNTDHERELSQVFGIRSIPSMLFVPAQGKPQMTSGALPKETYEEVIQNFLLGSNQVK